MLANDDKWEKREARLRGSGTRGIKLEEFNIASPKQQNVSKITKNLQSAFTNPDDLLRPRLRQGRTRQNTNVPKIVETGTLRQENRKLKFSSDEDEDEDEDMPGAAFKFKDQTRNTLHHTESPVGNDNFDVSADTEFAAEPLGSVKPTEKRESLESLEPQETAESSNTGVKREHVEGVAGGTNEAKRRRGRPKKNEREPKATVVTRRSRRIVDNPSLRQAHVPDPAALFTQARPLRALGLAQLLPFQRSAEEASSNGALALNVGSNADANADSNADENTGSASLARPKAVVVAAERLHTPSTRGRRVTVNTLDVLQQYVEEYSPRPSQNELVAEHAVLAEFKAHLKYNLSYLLDQHATIIDLLQDIHAIQRRKNEVRRSLLELRRAHAAVGAELAQERRAHVENKAAHREFMAMANSLRGLKDAVADGDENGESVSELTQQKLAEASRIVHPDQGLLAQIKGINAGLAQIVRGKGSESESESESKLGSGLD